MKLYFFFVDSLVYNFFPIEETLADEARGGLGSADAN